MLCVAFVFPAAAAYKALRDAPAGVAGTGVVPFRTVRRTGLQRGISARTGKRAKNRSDFDRQVKENLRRGCGYMRSRTAMTNPVKETMTAAAV